MKLTQEEVENWSRPVTTEEIANVLKNYSTRPASESKWETAFKLKTHRLPTQNCHAWGSPRG